MTTRAVINAMIDNALAQITQGYNAVETAKAAVATANTAVTTAKTGRDNTRETTYRALATWSTENKLTEKQVNDAADRFKSGNNDAKKEKTVTSFANDCRNVMHPNVRERFGSIMDQANEIFDAEGARDIMRAAGKDTRRIHYALKTCVAAKQGKLPAGAEDTDGADVLRAAKTLGGETDRKAKMAFDKLKNVIKALDAVLEIAGSTAVHDAREALKGLKVETFKPRAIAPTDGAGATVTPPTTSRRRAAPTQDQLAPTSSSPAPAPTSTPAANVIAQADLDALLANPMLTPGQIMQIMSRVTR